MDIEHVLSIWLRPRQLDLAVSLKPKRIPRYKPKQRRKNLFRQHNADSPSFQQTVRPLSSKLPSFTGAAMDSDRLYSSSSGGLLFHRDGHHSSAAADAYRVTSSTAAKGGLMYPGSSVPIQDITPQALLCLPAASHLFLHLPLSPTHHIHTAEDSYNSACSQSLPHAPLSQRRACRREEAS